MFKNRSLDGACGKENGDERAASDKSKKGDGFESQFERRDIGDSLNEALVHANKQKHRTAGNARQNVRKTHEDATQQAAKRVELLVRCSGARGSDGL